MKSKIAGLMAVTMAMLAMIMVPAMAQVEIDTATDNANVDSVPPFIEKKWELFDGLYDEDEATLGIQTYFDNMPILMTKCAAVCDNNSARDINIVEAELMHELSGTIVDEETLTEAIPAHCTGTPSANTCEAIGASECLDVPGCSLACGGGCCIGTPTVDCQWFYENKKDKCDGTTPDLMGCTYVPDDLCWKGVLFDRKDPEFMDKYNAGICELYIGTFTLNPNAPYTIIHNDGWYKVKVTAEDMEGNTASLENEFEYALKTIKKPKVIKKWEISELCTDTVSWKTSDGKGVTGEVTPISCDTNTVIKCAVVSDGDGATDIKSVKATVYDPNGNVYDQETMTVDAIDGICRTHIHAEQQEVLDCLNAGTCEIYIGSFDMEYDDLPGNYKVRIDAEDFGGVAAVPLENMFKYNELVALGLDTDSVSFGTVTPCVTSWVYGDDIWSTSAPTVKNCGNVQNIDVDVAIDDLTCTTPAKCDGDVIDENEIDTRIDGKIGGDSFGDECINTNIDPAVQVPFDISLHPHLGLLPGTYKGKITLTALKT